MNDTYDVKPTVYCITGLLKEIVYPDNRRNGDVLKVQESPLTIREQCCLEYNGLYFFWTFTKQFY